MIFGDEELGDILTALTIAQRGEARLSERVANPDGDSGVLAGRVDEGPV